MASLDDVELQNMTQDERAKALGMTTEQLTGRSLFIEFKSDEEERFLYPWAPDVDINKRSELDVGNLTITEIKIILENLWTMVTAPLSLKIRVASIHWVLEF